MGMVSKATILGWSTRMGFYGIKPGGIIPTLLRFEVCRTYPVEYNLLASSSLIKVGHSCKDTANSILVLDCALTNHRHVMDIIYI